MNDIPAEAKQALDQLLEVVTSPKVQREINQGIKQQQQAKKIAAVLNGTDAEGMRRFTKQQVGDVIALTILGSNGAIPPTGPLTRTMADFFRRVGAKAPLTKEKMHRAIDRYLKRNPPSPELLKALRRLVKEEFAGEQADRAVKSFRSITGSKVTQPKNINDRAPEGSRGLEAVADQIMRNLKG